MEIDNLTILSSCDALGAKPYEDMAIRLITSIRKNGGVYRDTRVIFYYSSFRTPSSDVISLLLKNNCDIAPVSYFNQDPNIKIDIYSLFVPTKYKMWLDTDIYIKDDFSGMMKEMEDGDFDIAVSPDQNSFHRWARLEDIPIWKTIYSYFGLQFPERKIVCHVDQKEGCFYFSSGLILGKTNTNFGEIYKDTFNILQKKFKQDYMSRFSPPCQVSLSVAIIRANLKVFVLPEKYHYYPATRDHKIIGSPSIIHYQDADIEKLVREAT